MDKTHDFERNPASFGKANANENNNESIADQVSLSPPTFQLKTSAGSSETEEKEEKTSQEAPYQMAAEGSEPPVDASSSPPNEDSPPSKPNNTGLPNQLKNGIESLSGFSFDDVNVHYNSSKPAQMQAHAYAQGTDIHLGPGQERHLPHEAWHVVQQKQGRVQATTQMKGIKVNDDSGLEKEADVMGAKAMQMGTQEKYTVTNTSIQNHVVQRRMGMEAETRRTILNPDGQHIDKGDTKIIEHEYFTLVTDKFKGTSNLEFVMKHFDQLSGTEEEAIKELTYRITAMEELYNSLYANEGKLGEIVTNLGDEEGNIYSPQNIKYIDKSGIENNFNSRDTRIQAPNYPGEYNKEDDGLLYVHYTVGFAPKNWKKMIEKIHNETRRDTDKSRPKTIAGHALEAVSNYSNPTLTTDELEEAQGHLALMYMQMNVWVDKTISSDKASRKAEMNSRRQELKATQVRFREIEVKTEADRQQMLIVKEELNSSHRAHDTAKEKFYSVKNAMKFGQGQQKNKIAALPRATLNQMYEVLSPNVKNAIANDKQGILDLFAEILEKNLNIDMNENSFLGSDELGWKSLGDFLAPGFGNGEQITQQILFGGMNEVGIDNSSESHPDLLPLEFRSILKSRISWDELLKDSIEILKWSRNP